jgi:hypothetical protein
LKKSDQRIYGLVLAAILAVTVGYYFWDGYRPARSIKAGLASLFLGLLYQFLVSGLPDGGSSKSKDLPPVIR